MGIHPCEYCYPHLYRGRGETGVEIEPSPEPKYRYLPSSSGDVEIYITVHGHEYKFAVPDMILHYIHDHKYSPCPDFVDAILFGEVTEVIRMQTKGLSVDQDANTRWFRDHGFTPVGYLQGEFRTGEVPEGFISKLQEIMESAEGFAIKY